MPTNPTRPEARFVWTALVALLALVVSTSALFGEATDDLDLIESLGRPKPKPVKPATVVEDGVEIELNTKNPQPVQITQLLTGYRKHTNNPAVRGAIVSRLIRMGDEAQKQIVELIEADYARAQAEYRDAFRAEAANLLKLKQRNTTPQQIEALRKQVRDLSKDPDLTKEKIKKIGDPAMAQLTQLLTIDRASVLNGQGIQAKRRAVLDLAVWSNRAKTGQRSIDTSEIDRQLTQYEEAVAMTALSGDERDRKVMAENAKLARTLDPKEAEGILRLNVIRLKVGLPVQKIDPKLVEASRDHSNDMSSLGFFSHMSPVSGKRTPWDRAKKAGTSASGENIYMGINSAQVAITGWWYSPGHHKNLMKPGNIRVGLGKYQRHWTQMFGR